MTKKKKKICFARNESASLLAPRISLYQAKTFLGYTQINLMLHFVALFSCRTLHNSNAPEHLLSYKDKECGLHATRTRRTEKKKKKLPVAVWENITTKNNHLKQETHRAQKTSSIIFFVSKQQFGKTILAVMRQPLTLPFFHPTLGVFRLVLK